MRLFTSSFFNQPNILHTVAMDKIGSRNSTQDIAETFYALSRTALSKYNVNAVLDSAATVTTIE